MPPPSITVAIPTFNGARHVGEAIAGVIAQAADASFDLLVIDDRSDDDTVEKVRALAGDRARVEINSERLGLAGNWNRCIDRAETDWVAVFHQDDVMRPRHLARHLGVICHLASTGAATPALVAGPADPIDQSGEPIASGAIEPGAIPLKWAAIDRFEVLNLDIGIGVGHYPPGSLPRDLAVGNPLRCSAVTLRRDAIRAIGCFDPRWRYAVDWDAWLRLTSAHPACYLWMPATVGFRWHLASETHRFKTGTSDLDEQRELLAALHASPTALSWPDLARVRREAHRRLSRAYLNRAHTAAHAGDRALEVRCLRTAWQLDPAVMLRLVRDPRLVARLVLGSLNRGP